MSRYYVLTVGFTLVLGLSIANAPPPSAEAETDDLGDLGGEDEEVVTEVAEDNPTIEPGPPPHDPFTLHPADEGAATWEDLTEDEKAEADRTAEWADTQHGADVHAAFSAAGATTSEMRVQEAARRASGLEGVDTLGVVP